MLIFSDPLSERSGQTRKDYLLIESQAYLSFQKKEKNKLWKRSEEVTDHIWKNTSNLKDLAYIDIGLLIDFIFIYLLEWQVKSYGKQSSSTFALLLLRYIGQHAYVLVFSALLHVLPGHPHCMERFLIVNRVMVRSDKHIVSY